MSSTSRFTIRVEGLAALGRAFRRAGDERLPVSLKAAGAEVAEVVAESARGRAPVGSGRDPHPGRLAGTIRVSSTLRGAAVLAGGARTPYAPPIHWGWKRRNIRKNPFLFDALEEHRPEVMERYSRAIDAVVREI